MKKTVLSVSLGLIFGFGSLQAVHAAAVEAEQNRLIAAAGEREQGESDKKDGEERPQDGAALEMLLNVAAAGEREQGESEKQEGEQDKRDGASLGADARLQVAMADTLGNDHGGGSDKKEGETGTQDGQAPEGR